jgi:putative selenium metabolism protein SsnA
LGIALINCDIFDYDIFLSNQYILAKDKIIEIGSMSDYIKSEDYEEVDLNGKIVLPGFVNAHTHIYSTFARGMILPFNPKSFKDILKQIWWRLDAKLDLESIKYSALISGVEFIKNGVTSVIDHHASGSILGSLQVLRENLSDYFGIRGIYCFETSDRFNVDNCIKENTDNLKLKSDKYAHMFGLHASMTLSDSTLEKVKTLIENYPIHIHVAESIEDEEDSLKKYNKTIVERLSDFSLINDNSILSHCVHINNEEAELIHKNKAYVALNPTSNMNNAIGIPNYKLLKAHKINALIGNDGLGYNITREFLNLYYTQKYRYSDPTFFNFDDLKNIIENNYSIVSDMLNIKIGKIKPGYKADLITFNYNPPTPVNENNFFGHLFFGIFDDLDVQDTLVDGKFLMKNKEIQFDYIDIYEKAKEVSKKLWERL